MLTAEQAASAFMAHFWHTQISSGGRTNAAMASCVSQGIPVLPVPLAIVAHSGRHLSLTSERNRRPDSVPIYYLRYGQLVAEIYTGTGAKEPDSDDERREAIAHLRVCARKMAASRPEGYVTATLRDRFRTLLHSEKVRRPEKL